MIRTVREGELSGEDSGKIMKVIAMDVCRRLNLQTEEVCEGLIDSEQPTVEYIMRNSDMDSDSFCSLFMGFTFCDKGKSPAYNWALTVDNKTEAMTSSKSDTPRHTDKNLKICQFTDIHHDPLYEPGSLAACEEPMCCQRKRTRLRALVMLLVSGETTVTVICPGGPLSPVWSMPLKRKSAHISIRPAM